jgi:hypothetical protein
MSKLWQAGGILLAGACLFGILRAPRSEVSRGATVVDTSAIVAAKDSAIKSAKAARASFDSLREWIATAPPMDRWRIAKQLVHDTVDTGRVDTMRVLTELILDDSSCHVDRDSLRGELAVLALRHTSQLEQYRLLEASCRLVPKPSRWKTSIVLHADGQAMRPGIGLDYRDGRVSYGMDVVAQTNGTRPGIGLRAGINW